MQIYITHNLNYNTLQIYEKEYNILAFKEGMKYDIIK